MRGEPCVTKSLRVLRDTAADVRLDASESRSEIEESQVLRSTIAIFIGAGLGGVTRHHFNALAVGLFGTSFSWGIFAINVMGSVVMGVIVEWLALRGSAPQDLRLFLTTGILGGFTTFSTFSLDAAWARSAKSS
jgi:protein CrcB